MCHFVKGRELRGASRPRRIQPSEDEGSNKNDNEVSNEHYGENAENDDQVSEENSDALKKNDEEDIPLQRSSCLQESA